MTEPERADVVILGASFTGVELVRQLRGSRRGRALTIAIVDRQAVHPYIPLGHELLCERMAVGVDQGTILATEGYAGARPGTRYVRGEIARFDAESHTVHLADGRRIRGRFVVVALGSDVVAPPGLPGGELLLAYKSQAQFQASQIALADALTGDEAEPTVLVVGGGISGVEIAGELAHLRVRRPTNWRAPKVVMVHSGDRLLPGLTRRAGLRAAKALEGQGVELLLRTRLLSLEGSFAAMQAELEGPTGARSIPCAMGFWGGGLQPPAITQALGLPLTEDGWLRVSPTLQCLGTDDPEIFAGGDIARVYGGDGRWPTMQRAIEGIFAAQTIARNILTLSRCPPDYPSPGVPPLHPHRLWTDFPHGVSIGGKSLIVYGPLVFPAAGFNIWFRRFLMRQYMRRYAR